MRGVFPNVNEIYIFLVIFPRMNLHCKLDPIQYREYEYGLLIENSVTLFPGPFVVQRKVVGGDSVKFTTNKFQKLY